MAKAKKTTTTAPAPQVAKAPVATDTAHKKTEQFSKTVTFIQSPTGLYKIARSTGETYTVTDEDLYKDMLERKFIKPE